MALADFAAYKNAIKNAKNPLILIQTTVPSSAGGLVYRDSYTGSTPSTAAALGAANSTLLSGTLVGGAETNPLYLMRHKLIAESSANAILCGRLLYDRLSHQGGLDSTITTEQTTNLPTAALTRYTDGVGVFAAARVYGTIGGTPQLMSIRYTNQAGTGSRTSKSVSTVASAANGWTVIFPLQDDDTGVRSIEGFTMAASTGTAGNIGLFLLKPLALLTGELGDQADMPDLDAVVGFGGQMPEIQDDACLQSLSINSSAYDSGTYNLNLVVEPVA